MEAVAKIKQQLNGWKIVIAGIESDYTVVELNEMAIRLNISDMVDVVGGLFGDDKWDAYCSSDVFVLPTLNENFGIVIAESYLCGTPVITTKGAPCGWWIDRTVDELTYAIIDFVHTPIEKRRLMGLRGRQLVKERFASDIVAKQIVELYNSII